MLYLRGGLIFSEGMGENNISSGQQLNQENLFYGSISQTKYRICKDIRVNPVEIIMDGNLGIVTFRGAPYDQISSEINIPQQQQKTQRPIGFRLHVYAKCGGILWVNRERKVLNTANVGLKMQQNINKIKDNNSNSNICEWNLRLSENSEGNQKIFVRVEQYFFPPSTQLLDPNNNREPPQLEFFCGEDSKGIVEASTRHYTNTNLQQQFISISTTPQLQHFHEFVCDQNQARLVGKQLDTMESSAFLINYDVASTFCGGQSINDQQGRLALNPILPPTECEWTINAVKGSHVSIQILAFSLPKSEFCTISFLEFREGNSSGQLIGRFCGDLFPPSVENIEGPIYIRLRHKIEEDLDIEGGEGEENDNGKIARIELKYTKIYGQTSSHIIESPPEGLIQPVSWRIATEDSENWIQFGLTEYILEQFPARLDVHPSWCFLVPSTSEEEACAVNDPLAISFTPLSPPERNYLYNLRSNKATIVFYPKCFVSKNCFVSPFKFYWKEVNPRKGELNGTSEIDNVEKSKDGGFTCGGELTATYKIQTLNSPIDQNTMNYRNNERCKWTIRRPQFANILLSVTNLDLEPHPECQYDWLSLGTVNYEKSKELDNIPTIQRICQKQQQTSTTIEINSSEFAFIYFYTDRSRTSGGFSLNYSLSCNSIELLLPSQGILDTHLSLEPSPEDLTLSIKNLKCHWSILVLSRRDIFVQALDMDLAPREWSSQECVNDALEFSSTPFYSEETIANRSLVHCGQEKFNLTVPSGYLFIRHRRALPKGRGFKLRLHEIIHDCASSIIQLDQFSPQKIITSPEFPLSSPNSLDCNWILSAPPGRRLQFTIDPRTFLLQNPISGDRCEEDYLEIRDGSSHASTLVGRFCETNAPSTFISTSEHLYVRYVTDSDSESPGWNATISLSFCGGSVVLITGQNSTIHSPNFPDVYPSSLNCEWIIFAPRGHFVEAMIEHFWLSATENCTSEYLTIRDYNSTGEYIQKPTCSKLTLNSNGFYRSQHRSLSILFVVNYTTTSTTTSYISTNTAARAARLFCLARKCGFSLRLWASKLSCGGTIKDDGGELSLPYGSSYMAEIPLFCQWNFQAGIGFRYLLDFEFSAGNGGEEHALMLPSNNADKINCFIDLLFYDGIDFGDRILNSNSQYFCSNKTRIISTSDISILKYDNNNCGENYLKGFCNYAKIVNLSPKIEWKLLNKKQFKIKYTKVPKDLNNASCMYELTMSGNLSLNMPQTFGDQQQISFCHIQIRKLNPDFNTLHLRILNASFYSSGYSTGKLSNKCINWESQFLIRDENSDPIDFEEIICRNNYIAQNNQTNFILLNSQLDIYAFKLSANIILDFYECGGVIDERFMGMSGELSSPGFGTSSNYSNGLECLWLLRAPESYVVEIKFSTMDLEYHIECSLDMLEVISGERQSSAVIHRYCNSESMGEDQKLPERFRTIRSAGRSLTLRFHTDSSITARGFSLQYTFSLPNPKQCGFNLHSLAGGFIQSPGYPLNDYLNNTNCLWDLQVPTGYHILITFEYFDIAQSIDCKNDFLKISEEHQSRAIVPLRSYYFYFDHESPGQKLCGNKLPSPIRTESNRVKINFATDSRKTAKGFKLRWEAVCGGAVFRNNHGVITSPNYPINYPNKATQCDYLIDPEVQPGITQIVTLKVLDFDLDNTNFVEFNKNNNQRRLCSSDYLEIKDVEQNITVQLLCGATFQADSAEAVSIKGPIGVRFVTIRSQYSSDSSKWKNRRGFKLSYALADCGGDVNLVTDQQSFRSQSVYITSPAFPLPYHHSLDCVWNITASSDYIISYKFTDLNIEMGVQGDCPFDSVEVFDGKEFNNQSRKLIICGDKAPDGEMKSSGSGLLVRCRSDHSTSFDGFRMVLTATLGPSKGCGGPLKALENEWTKLNVPIDPQTENYYPNIRCERNIEAERGNLIEIRLIELKLEQKPPQQAQQQ
uniref:CUB domain-containing protein n=1 Tax=Meloidogyne incognita TaxID=6306 RepID=A0A914LRI7_MELIC